MSPPGPKPRGSHQLTSTPYRVEFPREVGEQVIVAPRPEAAWVPSTDPLHSTGSPERELLTFRQPPTPNSAIKP